MLAFHEATETRSHAYSNRDTAKLQGKTTGLKSQEGQPTPEQEEQKMELLSGGHFFVTSFQMVHRYVQTDPGPWGLRSSLMCLQYMELVLESIHFQLTWNVNYESAALSPQYWSNFHQFYINKLIGAEAHSGLATGWLKGLLPPCPVRSTSHRGREGIKTSLCFQGVFTPSLKAQIPPPVSSHHRIPIVVNF